MFLTEMEIYSQQGALEKTFAYVLEQRDKIIEVFAPQYRKYVFFGCGSSYMLAKSAAKVFALRAGLDAYALAGGEYLLNPDVYQPLVENSIIVFFSRSGSTSEILKSVEELRKRGSAPFVTITMNDESELAALSDFTLALPWAYDKSVCQTGAITNSYVTILLLSAIYDGNQAQIDDVFKAISQTSELLDQLKQNLSEVMDTKSFNDVVVLADGVLCGLAEEAALAFTEICLVSGKHFNLLDYRHGPKVLNSTTTLTIIVIQPSDEENTKLQSDLLNDIKACGGTTIVICPANTGFEADFSIDCDYECFPTFGIPMICAAQVIAFNKAMEKGINPDEPTGLSAWISL
jgi:fructoselysine-6-P-deglycase FrlB-like protein